MPLEHLLCGWALSTGLLLSYTSPLLRYQPGASRHMSLHLLLLINFVLGYVTCTVCVLAFLLHHSVTATPICPIISALWTAASSLALNC